MLQWLKNVICLIRKPKPEPLPHEMLYHDWFRRWAFGNIPTDENRSVVLANRWNRLHGDKLKIQSHDGLVDAFPMMWEIYNDQYR